MNWIGGLHDSQKPLLLPLASQYDALLPLLTASTIPFWLRMKLVYYTCT